MAKNDQKPDRQWGRFNGKSTFFGVKKWSFWGSKIPHFWTIFEPQNRFPRPQIGPKMEPFLTPKMTIFGPFWGHFLTHFWTQNRSKRGSKNSVLCVFLGLKNGQKRGPKKGSKTWTLLGPKMTIFGVQNPQKRGFSAEMHQKPWVTPGAHTPNLTTFWTTF